jgi:bis(5'-nucleosyl)-tetraphosphatase (symmetrical)
MSRNILEYHQLDNRSYFHLLACALGDKTPSNKDTFSDILNAKDKGKLIDFLLQQPLVIEHKNAQALMV